MCMNSANLSSSYTITSTLFTSRYGPPSSKRRNLRVRRLNRRRRSSKEAQRKKKMELINLKLYRKNQSIIKQNEKLRRKALLLRQENRALLSQLQTQFPDYSPNQLPPQPFSVI